MTTASREHSLDAARGILMGMGVILHASNIYAPAGGWIVGDAQTHPFFAYLAQAVHVFRMPVFFLISGYFCCMGFMQLGSKVLLRVRMPRLLVPLLATLLTFNVLQDLVVGWSRGLTASQVLQGGLHLHHLWFLVYLLVYFGLAALLLPFCSKALGRLSTVRVPGGLSILLLVTSTSYALEAIVRLTGMAYVPLFGVVTLYGLVLYLPYFVAGVVMFAWRASRSAFVATPLWLMVPALLLTVGVAQIEAGPKGWQAEAVQVAHWLGTWISVGVVLSLFDRLFKTSTAYTRLISESAYTVYLVHHLFVVALGTALLSVALPIGLKFLIVCVAAWTLGLGFHVLLIRRVPVLRWLFNGRMAAFKPDGLSALGNTNGSHARASNTQAPASAGDNAIGTHNAKRNKGLVRAADLPQVERVSSDKTIAAKVDALR